MRKIELLMVLAWVLLSIKASAQQKEYSGQMHVTPIVLEQKGDSVYVKLNFDISGVNVDSHRTISLIPALVAPTDRLDLPEVVVMGRGNYHVYQREMSLMTKRERERYIHGAPYAVLKGFNAKESKQVDYETAIKYEPWMRGAKLEMYEDLCGCGNPPRRMGVTMLVNQVVLEKVIIVEPYVVIPHLAYIRPVVEQIKRREIAGEAFLDFIVNKIDIRSDYMNNPTELKKITDLITEVNSDASITIKAIHVDGFASPEGGYSNNKYLSEGRANALVNYLIPRFKFPKEMYSVQFGGENWLGLKEMVQQSDIAHKEAVLHLLNDQTITDEQRKHALKQLDGGVHYAFMLKEWYPQLRKARCKIAFEVKGFDVAEAKEVVKVHPQNLSLNELFLVANSYEKGSQPFIDLFEIAVKNFPDDATANLNAATAALSRGDMVYAKRYLERVTSVINTPEYYNTAGALAMVEGDYTRAESMLNKAVAMGSVEAKKNLDEISKKQANILQIEEEKLKQKK